MSDILWWTLTLFAKFPENTENMKRSHQINYYTFRLSNPEFIAQNYRIIFRSRLNLCWCRNYWEWNGFCFPENVQITEDFEPKNPTFDRFSFHPLASPTQFDDDGSKPGSSQKLSSSEILYTTLYFVAKMSDFALLEKCGLHLLLPALPRSFWACGFKLLGARGAIK